MAMIAMDRAERARIGAEDERQVDQARRDALAQYHQTYKPRLLRLLHEQAPEQFAQVHEGRATAPEELSHLVQLSKALERLVSGVGAAIDERLRLADEIRARIDGTHITNLRADYQRWRDATHAVL